MSPRTTIVRLACPCLMLLATAGGAIAAQIPFLASVDSPNGDPDFAREAVGLGDVDGDSVPDFAIAESDTDVLSPKGLVFVYSGATLDVLYQLEGLSGADGYGLTMAAIADVNSDGVRDLVIGAVEDDTNGTGAGRVEVRSGADGSLLHELFGETPLDHFGLKVGAAGDFDGDGIADFLVTEPGRNRVHVYSGLDASALFTVASATYSSYPESAAGMGDVDGDGVNDLLIGEVNHHVSGNAHAGTVQVISGATNTVVLQVYGTEYQEHLGRSVDGGVDLNGDGVPEFLAGAPGALDANGDRAGSITCYDGATGAILARHTGDSSVLARLGQRVKFVGDTNGDGFADYAAVAHYTGTVGASGFVRFYSGADHHQLFELQTEDPYDFFGSAFAELGDVNGDLVPDFLVGAKASRNAYLATTMGAQRFGESGEAAQILQMDWIPSGGSDVSQGRLAATGGPVSKVGFHLLGLERVEWSYRQITILVDFTAPGSIFDPFLFDSAGSYTLPEVSLRMPALDGVVAYSQVLAIDTRVPRGISSSNGLAFLLGD